jgi:hypothetical protein
MVTASRRRSSRCIGNQAQSCRRKGGDRCSFRQLFNSQILGATNNPVRSQPVPQPKTPRIFNSQVTTQTIEDVDKELAQTVPLNFRGTIPDEYWMHADQLTKVIDCGFTLVSEDAPWAHLMAWNCGAKSGHQRLSADHHRDAVGCSDQRIKDRWLNGSVDSG